MSSDAFFDHLFEYSLQVTPYLAGALAPLPEPPPELGLLHIDRPCSDTIQALYERLKSANPEAGPAYWLTRSWDVICWQPVYVAFVSIYTLHGLPELKRIAQTVQSDFVSGYQFDSAQHQHGTEEALIAQAGVELATLFEFYRNEMSQWTRIRPGFTRHLLADCVLGCLVKLSQFAPDKPVETLLEHAQLWLKACGLPLALADTLTVDNDTGRLKLVRTSCCLVIKCTGRELCQDCPRHPDNKR
ncbi:siderophore ferric iron reductase [Vibrio ostreicida]|uniref:siderophore ferric iron reductase n=1 Tax=Vibrio ostreicida TaxID=526588 RepID=UPI003B5A6ABB